jgi:hypothetical protein
MKNQYLASWIFCALVISAAALTGGCSSMFGDDAGSASLPKDTQELITKAEEGCPCDLPANETNQAYVLSAADQTALTEYKTVLKEKLLDSRESRLKQALSYQELYLKARSESDKTAEEYMEQTLDKINDTKGDVSPEGLNEMRAVLTTNIDEVNSILVDFKDELDPTYYAFTGAELKILIQARKLVIDEIASRQ